MSRGKTWLESSLGRGREERKLFDGEGVVEEEENSLLYEERLLWLSRGDRWGEL